MEDNYQINDQLKADPKLWVPCASDAIERLCNSNIPKDWLIKKQENNNV